MYVYCIYEHILYKQTYIHTNIHVMCIYIYIYSVIHLYILFCMCVNKK